MTQDRALRRRRSAALLTTPFVPGDPEADRIFALMEAHARARGLRLNAPGWAPTIALNAAVQAEFGLQGPTTASFFEEGAAPGLLSVSAGIYPWLWLPGAGAPVLALLERDMGAPVYPGHLTEPAGRCGERPSQTMTGEVNQELLIVATGQDPVTGTRVQRAVALAFDFDQAMDPRWSAMKREQVRARAGALARAGVDPQVCAATPVLTVMAAPRAADLPHAREVLVQAEGRVLERFQAIAWVLHEERCVEIRRSAEIGFPAWVEEVAVVDGERFDRTVRLLPACEIGNTGLPLIPSLAAYRNAMTRPELRLVKT